MHRQRVGERQLPLLPSVSAQNGHACRHPRASLRQSNEDANFRPCYAMMLYRTRNTNITRHSGRRRLGKPQGCDKNNRLYTMGTALPYESQSKW